MVADPKDIASRLEKRWNNVGVVAALVATMASTILVTETNSTGTFFEICFASITGISFVLSLASVLCALILFVQINNLFRESDLIWFIKQTDKFHFLPSRLLELSIATLVVGHGLLILLIHDNIPAAIVMVASIIMLVSCYWFNAAMSNKVDNRLAQLVSNVEELQMVFRMIDTEKAGKVTADVMIEKLKDKRIQNYIQVSKDRIVDIVNLIDADGDGWVTWPEFRDHLSNRRSSNMFGEIDLDGDGVISSEEFSKFYAGVDLDEEGAISNDSMSEIINTPKSP